MSAHYELLSLILPVYKQRDHIARMIDEYGVVLEEIGIDHELILVPNGPDDGTFGECARLAEARPTVRNEPLDGAGWGRAVQHGLHQSRGDLLCYTNTSRTTSGTLALVLECALALPNIAVKANRKVRESRHRRIASMLYNIEARVLFDLSNFDINGTPKVFPRTFSRLLQLSRHDDLIDLEFCVICRQEKYLLLEVPLFSETRHGGRSTTNVKSALKMYSGAWRMRKHWTPRAK